mmetsp:Transcript_54162/g.107833  ORF Transcript_54162/g.107833 Transcript_54162/m.107833 type:complete len:274 (-) Transcript_54162:2091-2912(-)
MHSAEVCVFVTRSWRAETEPPSSKRSGSCAMAFAPCARVSQTMPTITSRSSSCASRSSCSSLSEAAALCSRVNSCLPSCFKSRFSICRCLVSSPRQRCRATTTSSSTGSLRWSRASTADAAPSCTHSQRGKRHLAPRQSSGRTVSSNLCLREGSDSVFNSSNISGTKFVPGACANISTAAVLRCRSAASRGGPASSLSILTSAAARINASTLSDIELALARAFMANKLRGARPRPCSTWSSMPSFCSLAFTSARSITILFTIGTSISRSSSSA